MTSTHARYQHMLTLEVEEYPRVMAAMFPDLRELKDGEKPLAFAPAAVMPDQAVAAKPRSARLSK